MTLLGNYKTHIVMKTNDRVVAVARPYNNDAYPVWCVALNVMSRTIVRTLVVVAVVWCCIIPRHTFQACYASSHSMSWNICVNSRFDSLNILFKLFELFCHKHFGLPLFNHDIYSNIFRGKCMYIRTCKMLVYNARVQ